MVGMASNQYQPWLKSERVLLTEVFGSRPLSRQQRSPAVPAASRSRARRATERAASVHAPTLIHVRHRRGPGPSAGTEVDVPVVE